MRLDHVSYVTSHDQLADTVQRLGARLGSTFVDGGIHPRFGTRNFTAPLKNGQYVEVVCPLDHPATEETPWGKAVAKKAQEGGGWFTWVFSTEDLTPLEERFGRQSIEGHRRKPNGTELRWKQIGVKEIIEIREFPFFIQWLTEEHPSNDGLALAQISKIVIADKEKLASSWFKQEILDALGDVEIIWKDPSEFENMSGIVEVHISTTDSIVVID
jgi:Glyoxalase-like domain